MGSGPASSRTSEQKQENERRWREWVRGELASGVTPLALIAQLVKRGWPRERATLLVSSHQDAFRPQRVAPAPLVEPEIAPAARPSLWPAIHMLLGGIIVLVGAALVVNSMVFSNHRGPPVAVGWGAIGIGAIQFCYGLVRSIRARR